MPTSSSSPCSISASTWLRPKPTLTRPPSPPPPPPPPPSSSPPEPPPWAPCRCPPCGGLCDVEVDIRDLQVLEQEGLHVRLLLGERNDHIDLFGPGDRLVHIGLGGIGGAARVRVVDPEQLLASSFDRFQRVELA